MSKKKRGCTSCQHFRKAKQPNIIGVCDAQDAGIHFSPDKRKNCSYWKGIPYKRKR